MPACRLVILDHMARDVYLLTLVHSGSVEEARAADAWRWQRAEEVQHALEKGCSSGQHLQHKGGAPVGAAPAACSRPSTGQSGLDKACMDLPSRPGPVATDVTGEQRRLAHGHYPAASAPPKTCGRACLPAANGHALRPPTNGHVSPAMSGHSRDSSSKAFRLHHPRLAYIDNVQACKDALYAGESYELCLTTALSRPAVMDPLQLYYTLRRRSPAPYAAFLSFGASGPHVRLAEPHLIPACPSPCVERLQPSQGHRVRSDFPE